MLPDPEGTKRIVEAIRKLESIQHFFGGSFLYDTQEHPLETTLAHWLWLRLGNPSDAVNAFDTLIRTNRAKARTYVVIAGLCPTADITFTNNLTLGPLAEVRCKFAREIFPNGNPCETIRSYHHTTGALSCLCLHHEVRNLLLDKKGKEQFHLDGLYPSQGYREAVNRLETVVRCLGLAAYAPVPVASWFELDTNTAPQPQVCPYKIGGVPCPFENFDFKFCS